MCKIPIIIQASNLGESLEGRYQRDFVNGDTILSYLIKRLLTEYDHYQIVLSTSARHEDDSLEEIAQSLGICAFRGEYDDIPARLLGAVSFVDGHEGSFVRLHGNSPFVDFVLMEQLVAEHMFGGYDYSYNEHLHGTIWGTGCEIFSVGLMRRINNMHLRRDQMIALGAYLRQNRCNYKIYEYRYPCRRPGYKVNVETERDFEVVSDVAKNVSEISSESIIHYLDGHEVLAKYNMEFPLRETGTEKLLLNTQKVNHIRASSTIDFSYPISVELTLTNSCNLRCAYCSDMKLRENQGMSEQIELSVLCGLFDDLASGGARGIVFEGGGEPTLYPDFDKAVIYAKKVGLAAGLITNGTQPLMEETIREFEWIRVSLDASTANEYRTLKGVDCFEQVISHIVRYARFCPSVGVGYVVTNQNISQIESLVLRLRELGVSYIQCRPVVDDKDLYPYGIDLSYLQSYQTSRFGVMVDGMVDNARGGNEGLPCKAHSITTIISGNGNVYICGRLNIYDWLRPIGNITRQSFHSIWNGDERVRQAEMISHADFCMEHCPQCRITKFNVLVDKLSQVRSVDFI